MKDLNEIWNTAFPYHPQQKMSELFPFLSLIQNEGVQNILEIGSCYGGTTMCFAQVAKRVIAIDVPVNKDLLPVEELKKLCDFHYVVGNSHDERTVDEVRNILVNDTLDLLFIDGDHTAVGAQQDFDMYCSLVKAGGLIAFHDIVDSPYHRSAFVMVAGVYNELAKQYDHTEFLEPGGIDCGIGVLKTKDK